jgi:hypothetical protein
LIDLPSIQPRSGDGLDGRRRIGANPAEGDAGSADTPSEPRQPPRATQPDEGLDPALGDRLAVTKEARPAHHPKERLTTSSVMSRLRMLSTEEGAVNGI